ncbi:hypothetical protein TRL7639_02662 [Falsiruegeria litorea R37]|uniref:Lipoprotein n=1 Tax=Falsiruegeria litorea R37 TaxID=1200284 RepID=A0A1Y5SUF6_9RHOB|nr:hypothetical protein [Falsiruegeria litorea]SLN48329.1 hypothetical protein TRL7639_02662 [Falsiruegeria litorea R37]
MKLRLVICLLPAFAACTQVPELNDKVSSQLKNANYPQLVPLDQALGPSIAPEEQAQKVTQQLEARRDSLKQRAAALQKPVVDAADRDRLDETVPRPASD